jgi:hypothetical protein
MAWYDFMLGGPAYGVGQDILEAGQKAQDPNANSRYLNMSVDQFFDRRPGYVAGYDPATMASGDKIKNRYSMIGADAPGFKRFSAEAMRSGPSAWARAARGESLGEEATARERGGQELAGRTAGARSQLAMRGGLTSGAAERLATTGRDNFMRMSQDTARAGAQNRMSINTQDEQNRQGMLSQLPGMELGRDNMAMSRADAITKGEQMDIDRQLAETDKKNRFAMDAYNSEGQVYGAVNTAQAMKDANKDSWVCTALAKRGHLTPIEHIRALRKHAWKEQPELTRLYLSRGHQLVDRMQQAGYDWAQLSPFHKELKSHLAEGRTNQALKLFIRTISRLWAEYWPDCESNLYQAVKGAL